MKNLFILLFVCLPALGNPLVQLPAISDFERNERRFITYDISDLKPEQQVAIQKIQIDYLLQSLSYSQEGILEERKQDLLNVFDKEIKMAGTGFRKLNRDSSDSLIGEYCKIQDNKDICLEESSGKVYVHNPSFNESARGIINKIGRKRVETTRPTDSSTVDN